MLGLILLGLGAVFVVAAAASVSLTAGVAVLGVLLLAAGWDLAQ